MQPRTVLSYFEMCSREGTSLQRGMNFRLHPTHSLVLMSVRKGAPYEDRIEEDGRVLIYEGHDVPRSKHTPDPKSVDQPMVLDSGALAQNGQFHMAAEAYQNNELKAERVRVYEKVRSGIWVYNGLFLLTDSWQEQSDGRYVFKFRLELGESEDAEEPAEIEELEHSRLIPSQVKLEVWKRDGGKCTKCGATDHLHFDHVIPFSRGGASLTSANVQLLCARHNLEKRDRIE